MKTLTKRTYLYSVEIGAVAEDILDDIERIWQPECKLALISGEDWDKCYLAIEGDFEQSEYFFICGLVESLHYRYLEYKPDKVNHVEWFNN